MMLGEKRGDLDPRYFCHAFDIEEKSGWIYREWDHWFKTLAGSGMADIESIHDEFDRLRKLGNRFGVTEPSTIATPADKTQESLLKELFGEYVNVPGLPKPSPFQQDFEHVLQVSELMHLPTFHRDVEVEIGSGAHTVFAHFDGVLEEPAPLGIKVVQFQRIREHTLISQINDTLYSFGASVNQGFLVAERCIVLYDRPPSSRWKHLQRLSRHAKLLPLWENNTPRELHRIALMQ
jgi:hypothetical protein